MEMITQEVAKQKPIEVFCCYAHQDHALLLKLKKYLVPLQREKLIILWADLDVDAGIEWEKEVRHHLNSARIILLLVSPDFMASDYCYSMEMQRAIERHDQGEACVIPIILRPVSWQNTPFGKLQVLPINANPITSGKWRHQDDAFYEVVEGIRSVVEACLVEDERRRQIAEEERVRLVAEAERARQIAEEERARLAEEERARLVAEVEQGRQAEEKLAQLVVEGEHIHNLVPWPVAVPELAQLPRHFESIGVVSDHKPSLPIPGELPVLTPYIPPLGGAAQNQQTFISPLQRTENAVVLVQQRPFRRLLSVIKKIVSITGMIIGLLFALMGILLLFVDNADIFIRLWLWEMFFFFGLMIFFVAIIWSPSFIPKAGKMRAIIGKLIGIIAILLGGFITVEGMLLSRSDNTDGGGAVAGIISILVGIIIWWATHIRIKEKPLPKDHQDNRMA